MIDILLIISYIPPPVCMARATNRQGGSSGSDSYLLKKILKTG